MSYQKLNTSRAWKVIPNDDTPLPNIGGPKTRKVVLELLKALQKTQSMQNTMISNL